MQLPPKNCVHAEQIQVCVFFFFFLEMEGFYKFKRVLLPMHSGASEFLSHLFFFVALLH